MAGAVRRPAVRVVRKPPLHVTEEIGTIVADSITTRCPNNQTLPVRPLVDSSSHPFTDSFARHGDHTDPL